MIMYLLNKPATAPRNAIILCAAISASLLAGAHLFERVGGLAPCLLCLEQREVHWAALAAAALTFGLIRVRGWSDRILTAALGSLVLLYLFSTGIAGYHAGVEWGFWPGPNECSAGASSIEEFSADDLLGGLDGPVSGPSCSDAAWRMMGISMAGYNALISLAMGGLAALSTVRAAQQLRANAVGGVKETVDA